MPVSKSCLSLGPMSDSRTWVPLANASMVRDQSPDSEAVRGSLINSHALLCCDAAILPEFSEHRVGQRHAPETGRFSNHVLQSETSREATEDSAKGQGG